MEIFDNINTIVKTDGAGYDGEGNMMSNISIRFFDLIDDRVNNRVNDEVAEGYAT